jgi:hypothetical protein
MVLQCLSATFRSKGPDDDAEGVVSGAASAMRGELACSVVLSVWGLDSS